MWFEQAERGVDYLDDLYCLSTSCKYLDSARLCIYRIYLCSGIGGRYVLDEYGDRDTNFSLMYTTSAHQVSLKFRGGSISCALML